MAEAIAIQVAWTLVALESLSVNPAAMAPVAPTELLFALQVVTCPAVPAREVTCQILWFHTITPTKIHTCLTSFSHDMHPTTISTLSKLR